MEKESIKSTVKIDLIEIDSMKIEASKEAFLETVKIVSEARDKFAETYLAVMNELSPAIEESLRKLTESLKTFQIQLPDLEELQKINESINETTEIITKHNSSFGWTLTDDMLIDFYFMEELLNYDQVEIDNYFIEYYEEDNYSKLYKLEQNLKQKINPKWNELVTQAIELYQEGKYKVIIPLLISMIEGEIANFVESRKVGKTLLGLFEEKLIHGAYSFSFVVEYSLYQYLLEVLFRGVTFYEEGQSKLNRHAIMHGRDVPDLWKKEDALRLMNVLCSVVDIKSSYKEVNSGTLVIK